MKTRLDNLKAGLTLVELLVLIAVLAILAGFLLPSLSRSTRHAPRITCVNNLKQVGLSFQIYAGDNRDHYPTDLSTSDQPVVNELTPVFQYLQSLSNELGAVKVVICPSDEKRKVADDFSTLRDANISYFVGLDANENSPTSVLSGDRNIENGIRPDHGVLRLTTNQNIRFTKDIHKNQGNISFCDGSVQQVTSAQLRQEIIRNFPFATNRIKLP